MAVVAADDRLAGALVARAVTRLDAGQGFVRVPIVTSPLPVDSILRLLAARNGVRAAVFVPEFDLNRFDGEIEVTDAVHRAIDWRNDGAIADDLVVIGDLERDRASGLADLPTISADEVRRELFDAAIAEIRSHDPPAPLVRLLRALGDLRSITDLAACACYCGEVVQAGANAADVARHGLWRLGLFPDKSATEIDGTRLRKNADLIARVRALDATSLQRLVLHLNEIGQAGYDALRRFAATGELERLRTLDLDVVSAALSSVRSSTKKQTKIWSETAPTIVDAVMDDAFREEDFLRQLKELQENGSSDSSIRIAGENFSWRRVDPERIDDLLSDPQTSDGYAESGGSVETAADDERDDLPGTGDVAWQSLQALAQYLAQLEARRAGTSACAPLVQRLIELRRTMVPFLDSVSEEGVSLFVGSSTLRQAATDLIATWLELWTQLEDLREDLPEGDRAYVVRLAEQLALTDLRVVVRGGDVSAYVLPLHPLVLEPRVRAAQLFLRTPYLSSDFFELVSDSLDPAVPSITVRLGDRSVVLGYAGAWNGLPYYSRRPSTSDSGDLPRTIQQIFGRFISVHPYAELSLSVVLVEPSAKVAKAIYRWLGEASGVRRATVDVYATSRTADDIRVALDEAAEELVSGEIAEAGRRFTYTVSRIDDLSDIVVALEDERSSPHVVVFFDVAESSLGTAGSSLDHAALGSLITEWDFSTNPLDAARPVIRPRAGSNSLIELLARQADLFGTQMPTQERSPLLSDEAETLIRSIGRRATWVVLAEEASALVPPLSLGDLHLLGRLNGAGQVAYVYSSQVALMLEPILRYLQQNTWIHPEQTSLIEFLLGSVRKALPEGLLGFFKGRGNLSSEAVLGRIGLAAVLAYLETETPGQLVVSLDTEGARRWLGLRDGPELRADLMAITIDGSEARVEAIEIKARTDRPRLEEPLGEDLTHALAQVEEMARLVRQMFGLVEPDAFTPSRKEILKRQVFLEALQQWEDLRLSDSVEYERRLGALNHLFAGDMVVRVPKRVFVVSPNASDENVAEVTLSGTPVTVLGVDWFRTAVSRGEGGALEIPVDALDELADLFGDADRQKLSDLVAAPMDASSHNGDEPDDRAANDQEALDSSKEPTSRAVPMSDAAIAASAAAAQASDEAASLAGRLREALVARNAPFRAIDDDGIIVGPSVIQVPFSVPQGVKLASLQNQEADIARDMGVESVRITNFAGRPAFAVAELPRTSRVFPDVTTLELPATESGYPALAIGAQLNSHPLWVPLDDLPHLLVGGTTGSGKSVFLRSLLWQATHLYLPAQIDVVVIDAKGMADYLDFINAPHFKNERDFHIGVDGAIDVFEDIVEARLPERTRVFREYAQAALQRNEPKHITNLRTLLADADERGERPPLVPLLVVIDEFAELILGGGDRRRFETLVTRFNQTARAVGGHLVAATQRPSVDVVTGVMKSNFARVALRVQQAVDSRVILDENGAESLLGRGDLLFKSLDAGLVRLQGFAASGPYVFR